MRGDEERVVTANASWLEQNGWTVVREVEFVDVFAERGEEKVYAEAKGRTAAIGLDVDTLHGQLLRRMKDQGPPRDTQSWYRLPHVARPFECLTGVRERLHVDVFEVDDAGVVHPRADRSGVLGRTHSLAAGARALVGSSILRAHAGAVEDRSYGDVVLPPGRRCTAERRAAAGQLESGRESWPAPAS